MHRIDTSTAQVDKFGSGKNGFTGGNPQTGELPTALDENFFDSVQEEICNVIEGAGIALAKGTRNQLLSALKLLPRLSNLAFYTDTGAANAIEISSTPAITALVDGQAFDIACAAANTGAVTLKVNSLPAYPVIGPVGALQGGEIGAAKGVIRVIWSAAKSSFLLTAQNTSGPQQVAPAAQSNQAVNLGQFTLLSGDSGYIKFPNGVILQWGSGTITGGGQHQRPSTSIIQQPSQTTSSRQWLCQETCPAALHPETPYTQISRPGQPHCHNLKLVWRARILAQPRSAISQ